MIVCICKGVSDSTVRELLNHIDLSKVKEVTGASTQCGTCNQLLMDDMNGHTRSCFFV